MIAWAGYNHLQHAQAISAYYVDVQERLGGRDDPRLIPLLAGVIELLPWLKQWHHDLDPEYNQRMDEVYEGFVTEEAKGLGMTEDEVKAWQPPARTGRSRGQMNHGGTEKKDSRKGAKTQRNERDLVREFGQEIAQTVSARKTEIVAALSRQLDDVGAIDTIVLKERG